MSFVKSIVRGTTHPFDLATQLDPGQIFLKPANKAGSQAVVDQAKADAAAKAKAETDAAVEANNLRVSQKRAYQANALALGGNGDDSLGAPGTPSTVLSRGATPAQQAASVAPVSVLGGGAPVTSSAGGRAYGGGSRRTVARPQAL